MNDINLAVKSSLFENRGFIPKKYTARGEDISPSFELTGICEKAKSIAITMDDASHPLFPNYNHWLIWNLPVTGTIPEGIEAGYQVKEPKGARQGIGYGRNKYKGPKPPLKVIHNYVFTFYVLDCECELSQKTRKKEFLSYIEGHILQTATYSGKFQSRT